MYNLQIKTFLKVVDLGSFNKASIELYISASAVIKQINALEKNLGLTLLNRNAQGVTLTESGKIIYEASKNLINYADDALSKAKKIEEQNQQVINLGVSPMTPGDVLVKHWPTIKANRDHLQLNIVPFENSEDKINHILQNIGESIDIVIGFLDRALLNYFQCEGVELYQTPVRIGVPPQNKLFNQSGTLTVQDLNHQKIIMLEEGISDAFDVVRQQLQQLPDIQIEDTTIYNTHTFNDAVRKDCLVLTSDEWDNVHPLVQLQPLAWDCEFTFGVFYSDLLPAHVVDVIQQLQQVITNKI